MMIRRWLAAALLVTAGSALSPNAAPIYDGVGTPDQPYKYAGRMLAPAVATTTVPVTSGASGSLHLASSENGPQVVVDLAAGALASTGQTLTMTAAPLVANTQPANGQIDGNSYRITTTHDALLKPDIAQGFLFLRAAVMTRPDPVIEHRNNPNAPWTAPRTTRIGTDILTTPFLALGDYAVVRRPGSTPLSAGGLSGTRLLLLLAAGVLVLLAVTVLGLRRPRSDGA